MQQQQPLFQIYTREHLHKVTGFSKNYLSRIATGNLPLTRGFISTCCHKLNRPEEELFLPEAIQSVSNNKK